MRVFGHFKLHETLLENLAGGAIIIDYLMPATLSLINIKEIFFTRCWQVSRCDARHRLRVWSGVGWAISGQNVRNNPKD